jgi:hypothetical protein
VAGAARISHADFRQSRYLAVLQIPLWRLDQHQLDRRLIPQRGGEADLRGVVTLSIAREVHVAYSLDF